MELLLIWNGWPITSILGLPHRKLALGGDSLFWRRIRRKDATPGSAFLSIPTQPVSRYRRRSVFASEQSAASVEELGKDGDAVLVEVVGIGSRKDALLDFCLESPFFDSTSVRFWTMHMESGKVELHQKNIGKGLSCIVKRAMGAKGHCLLEMPTSIGKTIAPSKLIYCTCTIHKMEKVLFELCILHDLFVKNGCQQPFLVVGFNSLKCLCINETIDTAGSCDTVHAAAGSSHLGSTPISPSTPSLKRTSGTLMPMGGKFLLYSKSRRRDL
ncbi:DNA repair helicase [Nymphaea thermarum]|nr:DNA repair helicase [Nymphaea thermarum]